MTLNSHELQRCPVAVVRGWSPCSLRGWALTQAPSTHDICSEEENPDCLPDVGGEELGACGTHRGWQEGAPPVGPVSPCPSRLVRAHDGSGVPRAEGSCTGGVEPWGQRPRLHLLSGDALGS